MKRLISIFLVLVLCLSMFAGLTMAADKPEECTEADAAVKVTCEGDSNAYFFPELNNAVVAWTTEQLTGGMRTITFLKDIDSGATAPANDDALIELGHSTTKWGKKNYGKLTFDLNGHSWTYAGDKNMIFCRRYGCIIVNGTINYTCTEGDRHLFTTGLHKGAVKASDVYNPKFEMENVTIIDTSADAGHSTLHTYNYEADYTLRNCTAYVENGSLMMHFKGTQEEVAADSLYDGVYNSRLNLINSTVAAPGAGLVTSTEDTPDTAKVNVENTLVIGNLKAADSKVSVTRADTIVNDYTGTVAGKTATATAHIFGEAKAFHVDLPFTDVQETDWFYDYVSFMYAKKIINGTTGTTFKPHDILTYGQALKLIAISLGEAEQPAGSHWATGYLLLAKDKNWLADDVDLDAPISRLELCRIVAKAKGLTEQPAENPFKDTDDTSVLALVNAGVISGMAIDIFAPNQPLTRAQITKIITQLLKLY